MNMNLSKLWEIVKDREIWHAAVYGGPKKLDTTEWLKNNSSKEIKLGIISIENAFKAMGPNEMTIGISVAREKKWIKVWAYSFLRNLHTVSIEAEPVYIPINSVRGFPFLCTLSGIYCL